MLDWKIDKSWTLFLDRDGVINQRIIGGYVTSAIDFFLLDNVSKAIESFNQLFYKVVVVTNQQGIAKKIMSTCNLDEVHRYMENELKNDNAYIDALFYAPGFKNEINSLRKPNAGMALLAKNKFNAINFEKSIMVGDTDSDILFGKKLGMKTVRVITEEPIKIEADLSVESLYEFSKILKNEVN